MIVSCALLQHAYTTVLGQWKKNGTLRVCMDEQQKNKTLARVPWVYIWFLQKPRGTWIRKKHERSTVLETFLALLCDMYVDLCWYGEKWRDMNWC